ncbi:hypothetical protein FMEAI12_5590025 [Parafrankia sp. Ea1.12]|nr:hypothetical protein FMEAI12_5590025 [Parafrankia sp. Ea1.12]
MLDRLTALALIARWSLLIPDRHSGKSFDNHYPYIAHVGSVPDPTSP